jgi:hypothetical protein
VQSCFLDAGPECHSPIHRTDAVAAHGETMPNVQIFGVKDSHSARAAQRFFKERGVKFQFVDLKQKPMSPAEIKRFVDRLGISSLIDTAEKAYIEERPAIPQTHGFGMARQDRTQSKTAPRAAGSLR